MYIYEHCVCVCVSMCVCVCVYVSTCVYAGDSINIGNFFKKAKQFVFRIFFSLNTNSAFFEIISLIITC